MSKPRHHSSPSEFVLTILLAVLIAFGLRTFLFEPFTIPSSSMEPGLLVGDFLFVSKYSYGYSSISATHGLVPFRGRILGKMPARGDVAVFKLPKDKSTDYIKRIIGLPGDSIRVVDGILQINGQPVERNLMTNPVNSQWLAQPVGAKDYTETLPDGRKHIIREMGDDYNLDNTPLFTVPDGYFFAMGDNRDNSDDSRANVGFVPIENLEGKAEVVVFSLGNGVKFWEVWRWPWNIRWGRLWHKIV